MGCELYAICVENTKVAKDVCLDYALIFAKAIMEHFYDDPRITVSIVRQERHDE